MQVEYVKRNNIIDGQIDIYLKLNCKPIPEMIKTEIKFINKYLYFKIGSIFKSTATKYR